MNWEDSGDYVASLQDSKGVNAECDEHGHTDLDKQDANVGSLLDQLKMHNDELRELSAEVGRSLTVLEAHTYRIRKLKDQLITRMLEEEK